MFRYLLLCALTTQAVWTNPLQTQGDLASHIVIVTPQAQVHLEPGLKYDGSATFIHHLSPLARIGAPHDETIVYVPASAAAPIIPIDAVNVGRSSSNKQGQQSPSIGTKQFDQISQEITNIQTAIQTGAAMYGPQFSEAASAAAAAATSAGSGLFPAFFPPASSNKDDKVKIDKIEYETPAATQTLVPAEARRYYALTPAVSHIVDFVHAPVILGPVSTIRARSIQEAQAALLAAPLAAPIQPEPTHLKSHLQPEGAKEKGSQANSAASSASASESEKKSDFGRFLEANALKQEPKEENLEQPFKRENLKTEQESAATNNLADAQPQSLAVSAEGGLAQAQPQAQLKAAPAIAAAVLAAGSTNAASKADVVAGAEVQQPQVASA